MGIWNKKTVSVSVNDSNWKQLVKWQVAADDININSVSITIKWFNPELFPDIQHTLKFFLRSDS